MDRFFDNYIMTPMQRIVGDSLRPAEARDYFGVSEARTLLDTAYQWLDDRMSGGQWAAGDSCPLAVCPAAPSLFYADCAAPRHGLFPRVVAYRQRLRARGSEERRGGKEGDYKR